MSKKVAIIGKAFRLPGDIESDEALWNALSEKADLVTEVPEDRFNKLKFYHPNHNRKGKSYSFSAGVLSDYKSFDYSFFNIPDKEAVQMDPQQHILLETVWRALEDAYIVPSFLRGKKTGVYIGVTSLDYIAAGGADIASANMYSSLGSAISIMANRISYAFDLKGPSLTIDTACSSSLVAMHQAILSLKSGEIDSAVVGSVNNLSHPIFFIGQSKAGMLSPDGRCKSFSENANGYVRSEGCIVIVLKRLEDAIRDQDQILAVVLNSGVNSDGKTNGLPMPGESSQYELLEKVYGDINFDYSELDYLEAHGTGTKAGDPVEIAAISRAIAKKREHPLPIGSIKSNLGHLEPAAGFAGLVKILLILKNRVVPPTIHCETLNKKIDFKEANVFVVREESYQLPAKESVVAGINSFGFGGTNAHVILSSYSCEKTRPVNREAEGFPVPFILSAKNENSLKKYALKLSEYIEKSEQLYGVAYNLYKFKSRHKKYLVVHTNSKVELKDALVTYATDGGVSPVSYQGTLAGMSGNGIGLVFTGNGVQWKGMGVSIYKDVPEAVIFMKEFDALFRSFSGFSILEYMLDEDSPDGYEKTELAQPALFLVQYTIVRFLRQYGLRYDAVIGHSVGEVAAAWACGALSLEESIQLIYLRSKAQAVTKGKGRMAVVVMSFSELLRLLSEECLENGIEVAAINSPVLCTVSGETNKLKQLKAIVSERKIAFKFLDIDYPFHTSKMEESRDMFFSSAAGFPAGRKNEIDFVSSVTGSRLDAECLTTEYWWKNLREPVQFQSGIEYMFENGIRTFIEIGPNSVLLKPISDCNINKYELTLLPSLKKTADERHELYSLLFLLLASDVQCKVLSSEAFFSQETGKLKLPEYCWDRKVLEPPSSEESMNTVFYKLEHPLLGWRLPGKEALWENHIDTAFVPIDFTGHRFGSSVLFPAAGFMEMAAAAFSIAYGSNQIGIIEDFQLVSPLVLDDELTLCIQFRLDDSGYFQVRTRPRLTNLNWTLHAKGRLLNGAYRENVPGLKISAQDIKNFVKNESHPDYDMVLDKTGLNYQGAFQSIAGYALEDAFTVHARLADYDTDDTSAFNYGVQVLDAGLQSIIILLILNEKARNSIHNHSSYLPAGAGNITFKNARGNKTAYIRTFLKSFSHSTLKADIAYYDAEGSPIVYIEDARFNEALLHDEASGKLPGLYEYRPSLALSYHDGVAINRRLFECTDSNSPAEDQEPLELLESLSLLLIAEGVQKIFSAGTHPEIAYTRSEFGRLFWGIDLLASQDILAFDQDTGDLEWQESPLFNSSPEAILEQITLKFPGFFREALLLCKIGRRMDAFLLGELDPEIFNRLHDWYYSTAFRHVFYQNKVQNISSLFTNISNLMEVEQKYNVLEVGSGIFSGIFTRHSEELSDRFSYTAATYCELYLQRKTNRKHIHHRKLDLSGTFPVLEGDDKFDLIVCADLFPVEDKPYLIFTLVDLLKKDGMLLINEQKTSLAAYFLYSLIPNVSDAFKDNVEPSFYNASYWDELCTENGLDLVSKCSNTSEEYGVYSLAFRKTTENSERIEKPVDDLRPCWEGGVYVIHAGISDSYVSLFQLIKDAGLHIEFAHAEEIQGVLSVCLNMKKTILVCPPEELEPSDTSFDVLLMDICKTIAALDHNNLEKTVLVVLTRGGTLCNDKDGIDLCRNPKHAALTGVMRVISNEYNSILDTLCIDLQTEHAPGLITEALNYRNCELLVTEHAIHMAKLMQCDPYQTAVEGDKYVKKLHLTKKGSLNNLAWVKSEKNKLLPGQIAIKPLAVGLNFRDVMYSLGLLPAEALENSYLGDCLGLDFGGVVLETSPDVTKFAPGDRVMGGAPGTLADYVIADSECVLQLPDHWNYQQGATIFTVYMTAYCALVLQARIAVGERVLIHAGAGGVGLAAIQIAKYFDAKIFVTVGSPEKIEYMELLGIENIYNSRNLHFVDEILRDTDGEGVDIVLNSLAGEAIPAGFKLLKPFGRFIEIGKRDIYSNSMIGLKGFKNNITYSCVNIEQHMLWKKDVFNDFIALYEDMADTSKLKPLPYTSYTHSEIVEAFRFLQDGKAIGKVVIDLSKFNSTIKKEGLDYNLSGYYLVTGGTSGFGLDIAQHIATKRLEGLILISRRGTIDADAAKYFADNGVKIVLFTVDITKEDEVKTVFNFIDENSIPLKGILHAATVYKDETIHNMSISDYKDVYNTKVIGGMLLDTYSRNYTLDHFLFITSVTSYFGNAGQVNYVAANCCLESIIHKRRKSGLPGNYSALGGIYDTGVISRSSRLKKVLTDNLGDMLISKVQALKAMDDILVRQDKAGYSVMNYDLHKMQQTIPLVKTSRFDFIRDASGKKVAAKSDDFRNYLKTLSTEEAKIELSQIILEEVASILNLDLAEIAKDKPLKDYGLDSLMGVDLATSIERRTSIVVSALSMPQAPSVDNITEMLLSRVFSNDDDILDESGHEHTVMLLKHGESLQEE